MADHSELIGEIYLVEKLNTSERLKHAKKRRIAQLKKWGQYDKQYEKDENKKRKSLSSKKAKKERSPKIKFQNSVTFLEAAARNDVEEVRLLLTKGVSPDVANEDGLTALHQCCIDDSEEMMKLLIEYGANANAKDSEFWTPLHAAATCGHVHLCKYLIERTAELLAVNADGNMPYDICEDEATLDYIEGEMAKRGITQSQIDETRLSCERVMLEDMKALVEQGKDLEFKDKLGATPLHIAAANGYLSVAEFLLDNHVNVVSIDNDGWQPVHAAACWGQPVVLELLVQNGADMDAKTRNGETPSDICEDPEFRQRIVELKEEIAAHHQQHQKVELTRKRSHNTRSASVRRTSMREKSLLSWKEARKEAAEFRITNTVNGNNNIKHGTEILEESLPQSNIDEIQITLDAPEDSPVENGDSETEMNVANTERGETLGTFTKNKAKSTLEDMGHRTVVSIKHKPDNVTESEKIDKPLVPEENVQMDLNKQSASTKVHVKVKQEYNNREENISTNVQKTVISVSSDDTAGVVELNENTLLDSKKVKDLEKKLEINMQNNEQRRDHSVASNIIRDKQVIPEPQKVAKGEEKLSPKAEKPAPQVPFQRESKPQSDNSSDISVSSSVRSGTSEHRRSGSGTLTDLKKQRAARHQEQISSSLRFRDTKKLENELAEVGVQHNKADIALPVVSNQTRPNITGANQKQLNNGNGVIKTHHNAAPQQRPISYGEPVRQASTEKKYRFQSTTEIIGDDENSQDCCVIS